MEKRELDIKITEAAKLILSYCMARTSNQTDAEDLAQDMIVEIYKSAPNIRNKEAFYSFMWAVAGNVYKQWCRKKAQNMVCELEEDLPAKSTDEDSSEELYLLRRELTLLVEKYRKAVILYYMENKSCSDISDILSVSESMVKYLLFKSRKILKEGISMERNYGEQSYNPRKLSIMFWGSGVNRYYHLCDSKISQNILYACYNDKLTEEQISLEIGVALPYMEDNLKELCEFDVLKKDGNRYYTNIMIFTREFGAEINVKTADLKERIADILMESISRHEAEVREIGFAGADMNSNSFSWQMVCSVLYDAIIETLQGRVEIVYPKDKFGTECFVWAEEECLNSWKSQFGFGISNRWNESGDKIQFMDFGSNGEYVHCFFREPNIGNVFLDIAKGNTGHFSENDKAVAAEMIRKGYVISNEKGLLVNTPIFVEEQYRKLKVIFAEDVLKIAVEAECLMDTVTKILKNHCPVHLKKQAKAMAFFRLFEDAISAPVAKLVERKYLLPHGGDGILPTTYVLLK